MKKSIFILLISSLLLNVSCTSDETCIQTKYVKLTAGFYHVHYNDTTNIYTRSSLSIDSLTVQGLKVDSLTGQYHLIDSILYNNKKSVSSINLPLSNRSIQSKFKLKFNTVLDTMTIYHTNLNDYLSLECGCIKLHSIDTVITTHHYIDSVRIIIHDVNTINAENIRLYK
jgi:hypothetical protein